MTEPVSGNDYYSRMPEQNGEMGSRRIKDKTLGMQDFLTLLVAQLQNQDMMNPMNDSEFISQMAQFSSVQAMSAMADQSMAAYAVSMIGKEVTTAVIDKDGKLLQEKGIVTGVGLFDGQPIVYIGDKQYNMASIMAVGKMPDPPKPEDPGDGGAEKPPPKPDQGLPTIPWTPINPPVTGDGNKPPVV